MSGTGNKTIRSDNWTKISDAGTSGYFQNTSNREILIRESVADPEAFETEGHEYQKGEKEVYTSTIGLWCRLVDKAQTISIATIIVTED